MKGMIIASVLISQSMMPVQKPVDNIPINNPQIQAPINVEKSDLQTVTSTTRSQDREWHGAVIRTVSYIVE